MLDQKHCNRSLPKALAEAKGFQSSASASVAEGPSQNLRPSVKIYICSFLQCTVCDLRHSLRDAFQKHIQTVHENINHLNAQFVTRYFEKVYSNNVHENNIPYNAQFVVTVIV